MSERNCKRCGGSIDADRAEKRRTWICRGCANKQQRDRNRLAYRTNSGGFKDRVLSQQKEYYRANSQVIKERSRDWDAANPEKKLENRRSWAARNPDKTAAYSASFLERYPDRVRMYGHRAKLEKRFGMTLADYDALVRKQDGVCAICLRSETAQSRGTVWLLSVDHDHATGRVRGLLCRRCNILLGCAEDDVDRLRAAITYLEDRDV